MESLGQFANTTRCRDTAWNVAADHIRISRHGARSSFRSVSVVSAVVRRPAPLGLKDALADVAVNRGVRRLLVLGRDVPQKRVLRRERDAALVAVRHRRRRRVDVPDVRRRRLRQLYKAFLSLPRSLASVLRYR